MPEVWLRRNSINNKLHEVANLRNSSGAIVAQKIRSPEKDFTIKGDSKDAQLFGSHNWSSGRRLIITEGEIDAMSVSQVQDNRFPVVSLPNGAPQLVKLSKRTGNTSTSSMTLS